MLGVGGFSRIYNNGTDISHLNAASETSNNPAPIGNQQAKQLLPLDTFACPSAVLALNTFQIQILHPSRVAVLAFTYTALHTRPSGPAPNSTVRVAPARQVVDVKSAKDCSSERTTWTNLSGRQNAQHDGKFYRPQEQHPSAQRQVLHNTEDNISYSVHGSSIDPRHGQYKSQPFGK